METNVIKAKIKDYLMRSIKNYEIQDDDNIFELGIVHSLFTIQLIMFIEKNFGIELEDEELDIESIRTINKMVDLIKISMEKNEKGALSI